MPLPIDCIIEILEYLSEDKDSLYSCLVTNRLFCRCVVPILWRNPWLRFLPCHRNYNYWKIIVKTIIKCFPQKIKQSLLKQQIYLNPSLLQQPLFKYVSYTQEISPFVIRKLTRNILEDYNYYYYYSQRYNSEQIERMFNKEFWSLFMKQCFKIKYLQMPNFNLFEYPGSKNSLSPLSTLRIETNYSKEMIIELSKNVHTLKRIEMSVSEGSNNDIETLIISQKDLKEILFVNQSFLFSNKNTIEYLSHSLRILKFIDCICLPAETITSFINLTELKIDCNVWLWYESHGEYDIEMLNQIFLPNLEILSLANAKGEDLATFTKLIGNTKGSLKILKIHFYRSQPPLSSIEFYLHTIQTTCPNIEVLPLWLFSESSLIDFENLLISCSKIRKIIIRVYMSSNLNCTVLAKPVLYLLAIKSSSIFLNNIHLIGRWSFSNIDLQEFFEWWKNMKRKPLTFNFDNNIYSHYIIKVCEFYHRQGVVKSGTINYTSPHTIT